MLHCYGVVRAGSPAVDAPDRAADGADRDGAATRGVEDAEVRELRDDGLAALVSDVPRPPRGSHANLTAHLRVLERALERGSVVPLAFGQTFPDDDAVTADLLDRHRSRLVELLGDLEGRVEMRVQGRYDEEAVLRAVVADDPSARRRLGATDVGARVELGRRITEGLASRRRRDTDRAVDALRRFGPWRGEQAADAMTAFGVSLLVERGRIDELERTVEELAASLGDEVEVSLLGPMPALSFVSLDG